MGVVIELSASEMPRFLPPPRFSSPFAFPSLRWGRKRRLRCFNPPATAPLGLSPGRGSRSLSPTPKPPLPGARCTPSPSPPLPPSSARRRDPIQLTYPPEDKEEGESAPPPPPPPPPPLPLDLSAGAPAEAVEARDEGSPPGEAALGWSLRSRARGGGGMEEGRGKGKRRKVELWVSLSKDEIEEDFLWMTGAKPPRRSMRRSKVASDLQRIFPGSCLPSKITADRYRVSEPSDCRKD